MMEADETRMRPKDYNQDAAVESSERVVPAT
jgi:hypothetical protein